MKKILYTLLAGSLALASCSKQASEELAPQNETTTFTLSVEDQATQVAAKAGTRATVAPARYVMEVYSEDGTTPENVFGGGTTHHAQATTGSFSASLDKAKAYTCLFWADDAASYDATSLKAVTVNTGKDAGEAYHAKVAVAKGKNPAVSVILKRAVAKVSLIETAGVQTTDNIALKLSNIYPAFSVLDGMATGTAADLSKTVSPSATTGSIATLYLFAKPTQELTELKFTYAAEGEKTVSNVPYQQNYATNIKGEYSAFGSFTFNVTADDDWNSPDNEVPLTQASMKLTVDTRKNTNNTSDATFILPLQTTLSGYSLTVDWGDGNTDKFADGTVLAQANMTHTYAAAGVYPITISSSQEDVTNVQMPKINFGGNYTSVNENPAKLISLDTPLLNMYTYDFMFCFEGCKNLTSISATLFENNTATADFTRCFNGCTGLTTLPAGLFEKNTAATNFTQCFFLCTGLTSIPATLFEKNTAATNFTYCFFGCTGLTSIPAGLFEKNTAATTFTNCFGRCTGLTTLPATLFEKNPLVTNFYGCFSGCTGLTTLPTTLFEKNPLVTNFDNCFGSCTGLTTLPPTLFEKNTVATDFSGCFFGCTGLTTLPATLFEKNTVATKFNNCFSGCTGLTTLPATLFEKNTAAGSFGSCFDGCTGLTSIPAGLFEKNTAAGSFGSCFDGCTKAVLNPDIFCTEASDKATRFAGKTMNFSGCFRNCGSDNSVAAGAGGVAPELWTYTMDISSTKPGCFTNVTKVTNAASIPTAWK